MIRNTFLFRQCRQWGFITLLALLNSCISDHEKPEGGADIRVNDELPAFSVKLNNGQILNSQSLEGKASVIVFMTVTCPDCIEELPRVEKLYRKYKDHPGIVMLAISREQGEETVSKFWKENGFTLPYSAQNDRTLYHLFARSGVPRIYLSDKQRKVRYIYTDEPLASYEELEKSLLEVCK